MIRLAATDLCLQCDFFFKVGALLLVNALEDQTKGSENPGSRFLWNLIGILFFEDIGRGSDQNPFLKIHFKILSF